MVLRLASQEQPEALDMLDSQKSETERLIGKASF